MESLRWNSLNVLRAMLPQQGVVKRVHSNKSGQFAIFSSVWSQVSHLRGEKGEKWENSQTRCTFVDTGTSESKQNRRIINLSSQPLDGSCHDCVRTPDSVRAHLAALHRQALVQRARCMTERVGS